ncbi:hypothetical protein Pan189_09480 [Stratiformator vulcanicus]|uniref:Uncharacterized protein n=1 Tax=Stratiformator vulcanicus TaxID=2527980 RepID=A0A517QYB9_9PLAN|nr:hypothetical protein Pan189_09480 [Stratiformator vulcanicus]
MTKSLQPRRFLGSRGRLRLMRRSVWVTRIWQHSMARVELGVRGVAGGFQRGIRRYAARVVVVHNSPVPSTLVSMFCDSRESCCGDKDSIAVASQSDLATCYHSLKNALRSERLYEFAYDRVCDVRCVGARRVLEGGEGPTMARNFDAFLPCRPQPPELSFHFCSNPPVIAGVTDGAILWRLS